MTIDIRLLQIGAILWTVAFWFCGEKWIVDRGISGGDALVMATLCWVSATILIHIRDLKRPSNGTAA